MDHVSKLTPLPLSRWRLWTRVKPSLEVLLAGCCRGGITGIYCHHCHPMALGRSVLAETEGCGDGLNNMNVINGANHEGRSVSPADTLGVSWDYCCAYSCCGRLWIKKRSRGSSDCCIGWFGVIADWRSWRISWVVSRFLKKCFWRFSIDGNSPWLDLRRRWIALPSSKSPQFSGGFRQVIATFAGRRAQAQNRHRLSWVTFLSGSQPWSTVTLRPHLWCVFGDETVEALSNLLVRCRPFYLIKFLHNCYHNMLGHTFVVIVIWGSEQSKNRACELIHCRTSSGVSGQRLTFHARTFCTRYARAKTAWQWHQHLPETARPIPLCPSWGNLEWQCRGQRFLLLFAELLCPLASLLKLLNWK